MSIAKNLAVVALSASLVAGCATNAQNQQIGGAATGAVIGGLITGLATGNVGYGLAGAAAGALLGWGAVSLAQYNSNQVRSAQDDQVLYGVSAPVASPTIKIRQGNATPARVQPGGRVAVTTDYSLMVPAGVPTAEVAESWTLSKDGVTKFTAPPQRNKRAAGGYAVDAAIPIPKDAEPGTYVVETKVQTGTSYDVRQAIFVVGS